MTLPIIMNGTKTCLMHFQRLKSSTHPPLHEDQQIGKYSAGGKMAGYVYPQQFTYSGHMTGLQDPPVNLFAGDQLLEKQQKHYQQQHSQQQQHAAMSHGYGDPDCAYDEYPGQGNNENYYSQRKMQGNPGMAQMN